jgi:hypothetical protein
MEWRSLSFVFPSKKGEKLREGKILVNPKVIIYGIFSDSILIPTLTSLTIRYSRRRGHVTDP